MQKKKSMTKQPDSPYVAELKEYVKTIQAYIKDIKKKGVATADSSNPTPPPPPPPLPK